MYFPRAFPRYLDPQLAKNNTERAKDAPIIRQLFSSSPRDPRYHMLQYISHKFSQELRPNSHEPRAALFLNRFTRTLTIMYATNGLADTLGISAEELNGKSFYYCIQENCLQEAVRCLESAKANDSIAYLRFWFRDPRQDSRIDSDESMDENHSSGDEDDGGVQLENRMEADNNEQRRNDIYSNSFSRASMDRGPTYSMDRNLMDPYSRSSSGTSTDLDGRGNDPVFERRTTYQSSNSSVDASDEVQPPCRPSNFPESARIELEAVVSCTSDGLVVIIRRARSIVPQVAQPAADPIEHPYANGFFASPWALDPIIPEGQNHQHAQAPWLKSTHSPAQQSPFQAASGAAHGPESEDFMKSIREVAVFAWALTGINGSLAQYGRGESRGESQPPGGLPVWQPDVNLRPDSEPYDRVNAGSEWNHTNEYQNRYLRGASNNNGLGYEIGNGSNCRKPCDFQEGVAANGGTGNSQWAYGESGEVQPWDRLYANERAARYEVGRYDEMR